MAALFILGAIVGGQLNRGIYGLAWKRRSIGPWTPPHENGPPRRWFDRLPILGWLSLRREVEIHGVRFWLRPMLIELFTGIGYAALYYWEIPGGLFADSPSAAAAGAAMLHAQFLAHAVLISLMVVATFIDFDEKTIPDEITVTGVIVALLFAVLLPVSRLPIDQAVAAVGAPPVWGQLLLTTPTKWPDWLNGPWGLVWGLVCLVAWCLAMMPRVWYWKGGLLKGVKYFLASITVRRGSWNYWHLASVGARIIFGVWLLSGTCWRSLLSALIGMAFGGGMIWCVRIVGSRAMSQEAMGFGDVTLMAMIGAFLGWQAALLVFFLAPLAALFIALAQLLLTKRNDIAFGPYLCLAALLLIVGWDPIWNRYAVHYFRHSQLILAILFVCLILMGLMLAGLVSLRKKLFSAGREENSNRREKSRYSTPVGGKKRDKKKKKKGKSK